MDEYMDEIENRLMTFVDAGDIATLLVRAPRAWGAMERYNTGMAIATLPDWSERRSGFDIMDDVRDRKSTRLNSSHVAISYAVFCLKKKKKKKREYRIKCLQSMPS